MVTTLMQDLAVVFAMVAHEAGNVEARIAWSDDSEFAWTVTAIDEDGISHLVFGPEEDDDDE